MFSDLIARAKAHFADELPFVLYRKPNEHLVNGIFQENAVLHHSADFTEEGFIFAPFNSRNPAVFIPRDTLVQATDFIPARSFDKMAAFPSYDIKRKEFHIELIKAAKEKIKENVFEKVVLSRCIKINSIKSPFELFIALLSNYGHAFCYLWFHPRVGLWLGATPEILLQTENKRCTTMSLAGTRVYVDKIDRAWGEKEREEQALVTQYIKRALADKVTNLAISDSETVRAGGLEHLRTKISGEIHANLSEIIKALHPTPAVCGMPLEASRNFIIEKENYDREFYTGFLGELNMKTVSHRNARRKNQEHSVFKTVKKKTTLWVNLRCMQLVDKEALIYVGGGITKDSIPALEWEETQDKSQTMLRILGLH